MVTNVLLILPLIIPGLAAVLMLFANKRPVFHRVTTTIASLMMVIVSIIIVRRVYNNGVLVTNIGDWPAPFGISVRSEEHTSELQSRFDLVCRLLLEKKNCTKVLNSEP